MKTILYRMETLALAGLLALAGCGSSSSDNGPGETVGADHPNILLVMMDDVGIDQMPSMGYGGPNPPSMPTIDAIAADGVRFRNTWAMPECSPGRVALLTGRYPLRSNIYQAIGPNDLANSQVSPYEVTAAKLLEQAGYESSMFGKFHLAGPEHNMAGNGTPKQLGWDYFYGWTGGLPGSIDTTAGGVAAPGTYSCGFVPKLAEGGAAFGACYTQSDAGASCVELAGHGPGEDAAGLQCLTRGGILVPGESCQATPPDYLEFGRENGHYVSPLVINADAVQEVPLTDPRGRGYRSTIEIDAAIDWIAARGDDKPWMATVSFSAAHTPLQPPPRALLPSGIATDLTADCGSGTDNIVNQHRLTDAMIEAMDVELGRLLEETGIATRQADGSLAYNSASDTLVVIVGDNGSLGNTVKFPFDPTRAKGSAYQTGVWVPLIVAGPMVEAPDRDVEHMVNATDVYRLFGEVAGLDVEESVPLGTDAEPMLPYLANAGQEGLRAFNFTQGGLNIQADGARNGPCAIANTCSHTPVSKTVCEDNGGTWWGPGADSEILASIQSAKDNGGDIEIVDGGLEQCWQVNQVIYHNAPADYESNRRDMGWTVYQAVRNENYKLVHNEAMDFDIATDAGKKITSDEFYRIDQALPVPRLDTAANDLLAGGSITDLSAEQQQQYFLLDDQLAAILASQQACPGDGNGDGQVDMDDIINYATIVAAQGWQGSSTYDFNFDGVTDSADLTLIMDNLGACP